MKQEVNRTYDLYLYTSMRDRPTIVRCSTYEQMVLTREERRVSGIYAFCECFVHVTYRDVRILKTKSHKLSSEGPVQGWVW